ncbi:hypothetical protein TL16_g07749 [Triparma laevis f. inornata]|uniref:Tr-type G domain-containing protein n=1 Tax=Triparma laevis f. inornata TaxID=1714386 RepID=A0A9W7B0E8_9STRA|nr:hypothetical protein TL16_g07749 [Triparma laevis f. inornata]
MSDADLYDEFGNYIGPESDSSDSEPEETNASPQDDVSVDDQSREDPNAMDYENTDQNFVDGENTDIVLHEDKQHYPTASDVYGEGVFTNVIDEDSQALEEPVLKREGKKVFYVEGKGLEFKTGTEFTVGLMGNGELGRTVAIIGNLHSGKTSVLDCILSDAVNPSDTKIERYSDTLKSEIARNMSIKMSPINVTSQSMDGKSRNVSWIDCPGHCQFFDETVGGVRGSDAVVVVLDCLEGLVGGGRWGLAKLLRR